MDVFQRKLKNQYVSLLEKPASRKERDAAALLSQFFHVLNKKSPDELGEFFSDAAEIESSFAGKSVNLEEYKSIVRRAHETAVESVFFDDVRILPAAEDEEDAGEARGLLNMLYRNGGIRGRDYRIIFRKSGEKLKIKSMQYL